MDFSRINRRTAAGVVGGLGLGLALASKAQAKPSPASSPAPGAPKDPEPTNHAAFDAPAPEALVGLSAGRYRVVQATPIRHGAFALRLADDQGDSFQVDVCALDSSADALRGPARTSHLELFLANEGDGSSPTHEAHGLAVMALAGPLERREHLLDVSRMLPLRERLRRFGEALGG